MLPSAFIDDIRGLEPMLEYLGGNITAEDIAILFAGAHGIKGARAGPSGWFGVFATVTSGRSFIEKTFSSIWKGTSEGTLFQFFTGDKFDPETSIIRLPTDMIFYPSKITDGSNVDTSDESKRIESLLKGFVLQDRSVFDNKFAQVFAKLLQIGGGNESYVSNRQLGECIPPSGPPSTTSVISTTQTATQVSTDQTSSPVSTSTAFTTAESTSTATTSQPINTISETTSETKPQETTTSLDTASSTTDTFSETQMATITSSDVTNFEDITTESDIIAETTTMTSSENLDTSITTDTGSTTTVDTTPASESSSSDIVTSTITKDEMCPEESYDCVISGSKAYVPELGIMALLFVIFG